MKQKIIYWFRWILAIFLPVVLGAVVNFTILDLIKYVINPESIAQFLNLGIFPFVIGFVFIQVGSRIAPKCNYNTAKILFWILIILQIGAVLLTPQSDVMDLFVKAFLSIIGGIVGLFIIRNKTHVINN